MNSRILKIKNAKFSEYYFYMNLNVWEDFQICISVPLIKSTLFDQSEYSATSRFKLNFFRRNAYF